MAPAHGTPFKGAVRYQKKQEMLAIAESLGLNADSTTHTREALESLITKELHKRRAQLESDPTYEKLYESLDRDARREHGESDSDGTPETSRSPRKVAGRKSLNSASAAATLAASGDVAGAASAVRDAAAHASHAAKDATAQARKSTAQARSSIENLASHAADTVAQQTHDVRKEGNALLKRARKEYKKHEKRVLKYVRRAREYASDGDHITGALIVFEAILLAQSVVPMYTLSFGQSRFQSFKNRITGHSWWAELPQFVFSVPQPQALLTTDVWQPLLLWGFYTFAIPYIAAHVITFNARESHSTFTFNFTRLIVLLYLVYVIPRNNLSSAFGAGRGAVSYEHVLDHVDGGVSVLLASLATGFTVYKAILHQKH